MSTPSEDELTRAARINGGSCAYPLGQDCGFTKRELLAAMAMQGICGDGIPGSHHRPEETARDAVAYADALLKELAK